MRYIASPVRFLNKKMGNVGENATSFRASEMNSALTFQLLNDRYAQGALRLRSVPACAKRASADKSLEDRFA